MNNPDDVMRLVSPAAVLKQIATAVPEDCRENIIIIGSLPPGIIFWRQCFPDGAHQGCRLFVIPAYRSHLCRRCRHRATFQKNWKFRPDAKWSTPGNEATPDNQLPAVRLNPPGVADWFIELLTVPEFPTDMKKRWVRLATSAGHFGLCSFGFLSLTNYHPLSTPLGIAIARPELMAWPTCLKSGDSSETMSA